MNSEALVQNFPFALNRQEETMTLIGLPSRKVARQELSGAVDDVVKAVAALIQKMVLSAIDKRTGEDFHAAVEESFPVYTRLISSLSSILQPLVPRHVIETLVNESYSELESDFREHATIKFGSDIKDQALFTVWMLRKTSDLAGIVISAGKVAEINKKRDGEIAGNYANRALMARFNIDCLVLAIHARKNIRNSSGGLSCFEQRRYRLRFAV